MKKGIPMIVTMVLAWCLASCEKDLDTYQGGSGIYFDTKEMWLDTLQVHWGLKNSEVTEQSLRLKICLYGHTADYDRKFTIEVESEQEAIGAVEEVDYAPFAGEYVMPAGKAEMYVDIKLLRSPTLSNQAKRFTVKLVENEELRFIYTREEAALNEDGTVKKRPLDFQRVIVMDETMPPPAWWDYYNGEWMFGTYSQKKAVLICDVMDIDRESWVKMEVEGGPSQGYLKFAGQYMHRWLQENPQTEEDGSPMQMGYGSMM